MEEEDALGYEKNENVSLENARKIVGSVKKSDENEKNEK